MNQLFIFLCLALLTMSGSYAFAEGNEVEKRLLEIAAEKEKIESYIKGGNSSAELGQHLNKLKEEESTLLNKVVIERPTSKPKKKKKKKTVKVKKRAPVKKEVKQIKKRPSPKMLYSKSTKPPNERYIEVLEEVEKTKSNLEKLTEIYTSGLKSKEIQRSISSLERQLSLLKKEQAYLESLGQKRKNLIGLNGLSGHFSAASDYVWRGQTQTNHGFAIQGGMDYEHSSGLSIGTWASNVVGGAEVDFYGGFSSGLYNNFSFSLGYIFYHYTKSGVSDTSEYNFGLSYLNSTISANYTDDYFGSASSSWYFLFSHSVELSKEDGLSLGISIGQSSFKDEALVKSKGYVDYKLSLTKSVNGYDVGLTWTDTDRNTFDGTVEGSTEDHTYSLNIAKTF